MNAIRPSLAGATQHSTPAQRKFDQLQAKIAAARAGLAAWDQALPGFSAAHAARVAPLRAEMLSVCEQLLHRVAALLDEKGFSKGERAQLHEVGANVARNVLEDGGLSAEQHAQWLAWHDLHAPQDLATQESEQLDGLREAMADATGLELDDVPADNPEELLQALHERLRERAEQERAARRSSAAQRKREAAAAAVQEQAQQSLRAVFRKLASALHPDRADDAADQARRTELMQRVNAAYAREDLLALYALQLEIEQVDEAHVAQATTAQLKHFNQVLQQQLDELQAELQSRAARLCFDFRLRPRQMPKPDKLGRLLNEAVAELRAEIYDARWDLRQLQDRQSAKQWLREIKQDQRELDLLRAFGAY